MVYMNKTDLKLYAITDRQWLHGARLSEHVKLAIEGGATMIQIRDKGILMQGLRMSIMRFLR